MTVDEAVFEQGRRVSLGRVAGERVDLRDGEAVVRLQPRFPPPAVADLDEGSCVAPTPGGVVAIHIAFKAR